MGIQQKAQKQKESLNTHIKNMHEIKYSTEDSAPNSSIKFNLNFQWPADCLDLSFKIWICRHIYLFWFFTIWLFDFFNKNTEREQIRIKQKIQQKVQSWIQACIFSIFCQCLAGFQLLFRKMSILRLFFLGGGFLFEYISCLSIISFNNFDLFSIQIEEVI